MPRNALKTSSIQEQIHTRVVQQGWPIELDRSQQDARPIAKDSMWQWVRLQSETKTTMNPGDTVVFLIPKEPGIIIDTREMDLEIWANTVQTGGTGGTFLRFPTGMWSVFQTLNAKVGASSKVQLIEHWNLLKTWERTHHFTAEEDTTIGAALMGVDTTTNRNTNGPTNTRYKLPLNCGVLCESVHIPDEYPDMFRLELLLDQAANILETDWTGGTSTYVITNAWLYYKRVTSEKFKDEIQRVNPKELMLYYHGYDYAESTLQNGASNATIEWKTEIMDANAVLVFLRPQTGLTTLTTLNRLKNTYQSVITSVQIKHGTDVLTPENFDVADAKIAIIEWMRTIGMWTSERGQVRDFTQDTLSTFLATGYFMMFDLKAHNSCCLQSGLHITASTPLTVNLIGTGGASQAYTVHGFVFSEKLLKITANKKNILLID